MSLLKKLRNAENANKRPPTHRSWLENLKERDPATYKQVYEVIVEFITEGRVGEYHNKADIFNWLVREGVDMRTKYSSFSRVVREVRAGMEHGTKEEEEGKSEGKAGVIRKPRTNPSKRRDSKTEG